MKRCDLCREQFEDDQLLPLELLRRSIVTLIKKDYPSLTDASLICPQDLRRYRAERAHLFLSHHLRQLSATEHDVILSVKEDKLISRDIEEAMAAKITFPDWLTDKVAEFGGSWKFITCYFVFLIVWIGLNSWHLLQDPFDPYPYIFLNLVLGVIAAVQAPIILMSQNRQESKDRIRSKHDYQINLKAELEVRQLNEKLDFSLGVLWQQLKIIEKKLQQKSERKKIGH